MSTAKPVLVTAVASTCALGTLAVLALSLETVVAIVAGAALLGAIAGMTVVAMSQESAGDRPTRWAPYTVAVCVAGVGVAASLALAGLSIAFGPATPPVLMLLLVLGAVWVWHARRARQAPSAAAPPADDLAEWSVIEPPVVDHLSTDELCDEWRRSYAALNRVTDQHTWQQIITARRCYLDELQRRDPAGFACWLDGGARPGSDPNRFLSGGR